MRQLKAEEDSIVATDRVGCRLYISCNIDNDNKAFLFCFASFFF